MKYKKDQIVFFNFKSFYGKFIEFYNKLNYGEKGYTHVGIITKVDKKYILIHEAAAKGFIKSWYPIEWINEKVKSKNLLIKPVNKKLLNVFKTAEKYLGRPYAWFDIFGIIISFLFGFKFLKLTGANKLICSEAVARILYDSSNKQINLSSEYNKPYDLISPMDIHNSKWLK